MSNFKTKFGKRLVELRKEQKLSQERLAEYIDIAPRNLSKIETGVTFPSVENLEKIIFKNVLTAAETHCIIFTIVRIEMDKNLLKLKEKMKNI